MEYIKYLPVHFSSTALAHSFHLTTLKLLELFTNLNKAKQSSNMKAFSLFNSAL